ncbi:hypothetical protein [Streptomyces sp. NPDC051636]|uniref:hypothetical protein n=1 Tax=Streptomyces sp. NPDC051636 TaxID=3365663 RepID=UPI0037A48077
MALQHAEGEEAVGAEDGGGAVGEAEQAGAGVPARGHVEAFGGQFAQGVGAETGLREGVEGAGATVGDRAGVR